MIVDERFGTYMNSLDPGHSPFLEQLEQEAKEAYVPIIRRQMQSFLRMFLTLQKPQKVLEVGTAIGFSSILMCEYLPETSRITTIENYKKRIPVARENFEKSGYSDRITLLKGDAADILPTLTDSYDLIFMDAAKGQYIYFLPQVLRLMRPGSVLITDNVLQDGDIIESHFAVERRNRTIYKRMREYLYTLTHHPDLVTSILPVGDGITVSVYKDAEE